MHSITSAHSPIVFALVIVMSLVAAIFDVKTRRIPNALALALFVCGIALNAALGWQFALADVAICAGILILGTIAFSMKLIGGGDVKLLAAAGGALGYPGGLWFVAFTFLCGGVLALVYAAMLGRFSATVQNVRAMALPMFAGVAPAPVHGTSMPYAVAICAGALVALVTSGTLTQLRI